MIANLVAPWYRVWFFSLKDPATLPFWSLVFIWIFGVIFWIARPLLRPRLTLIGALLLLLLPAATLWSFLMRVTAATGDTWMVGDFDPGFVAGTMMEASSESRIQLLVFLFLALSSSFLYWRHLTLSRTIADPGIEASPSQWDDL